MDITRNWRLKTSRSQLLATRCPVTGAVILPQQTVSARNEAVYTFELAEESGPVQDEYAQAAR